MNMSLEEARFWSKAEPLLTKPGVTRSTMMGLPCLRINGSFFASFDRRSGALLVKLPEAGVASLVAARRAEPFAPAGRQFREWAAIPTTAAKSWTRYLDQAFAYVASLPPPRPKVRRQ